jgi:hypothetical protein
MIRMGAPRRGRIMRKLTSYDYGAIALNALRAVYHKLILDPALYCRDVLSWKSYWALKKCWEHVRVGIYLTLSCVVLVWSVPIVLLEVLMSAVRPDAPEFHEPHDFL